MYYGTLYNYSHGDYFKLATETVAFDDDGRPQLRERQRSSTSNSTARPSLGSLIDRSSCETSYMLAMRCMRSPISLHPLKAPVAYLSWWALLTESE